MRAIGGRWPQPLRMALAQFRGEAAALNVQPGISRPSTLVRESPGGICCDSRNSTAPHSSQASGGLCKGGTLLLIICELKLPLATRSRSTTGEGGYQVYLVTVHEPPGFIGLPAIDDEQDGLITARNRHPVQEIRERATQRQRHVETAQRPTRRLALQGRE